MDEQQKLKQGSNKLPIARQLSLDPFEAATAAAADTFSPPSSPLLSDDDLLSTPAKPPPSNLKKRKASSPPNSDDEAAPSSAIAAVPGSSNPPSTKMKEEEEEEEENLDIEMGKPHTTVAPERMQAILDKFTPEQMSRYECYRRSGFQKANMRRLLQNIAGCPVSMPMTIVMSGIAKLFVGELVETGRIVMTERKETGPIRPCHIREAYRRLKLKGKVPQRTRPRLFR